MERFPATNINDQSLSYLPYKYGCVSRLPLLLILPLSRRHNMGDFSLNRPTALEFSKRPSSPSLNLYSGRIAASVFSTVSSTVSRTISNAVVGSSISLTALYLANINGRPRLCSDPSNFFEWLGASSLLAITKG